MCFGLSSHSQLKIELRGNRATRTFAAGLSNAE